MLVSHHPEASCWTGHLWRALEPEDPPRLPPSLIFASLSRENFSCRYRKGVVVGFCQPRQELGAGYSSVQLLYFLCKFIPSASSAIQLLDCPTNKRKCILYIPAAEVPAVHIRVIHIANIFLVWPVIRPVTVFFEERHTVHVVLFQFNLLYIRNCPIRPSQNVMLEGEGGPRRCDSLWQGRGG